jgi:hypothetical protein
LAVVAVVRAAAQTLPVQAEVIRVRVAAQLVLVVILLVRVLSFVQPCFFFSFKLCGYQLQKSKYKMVKYS